ncbi:phosphoribosyltransferase family protein [Neobacillus sp. FSL H8-0543]|uniref:phosphoribosyltransferase family protein n=1 Tax=Neobacillus sp. FSL H8-0543 TaxID=2954672 RepID=UPI0031598A2E
MKKSQTSTLLKKTHSYTILDALNVDIEVTANPYLLPIEELFTMAARINKKRSFLFVSKVLGKHIPITPQKGLLTAALLGMRYAELIKGLNPIEKERLLTLYSEDKPSYQSTSFIPKQVNPVVIGFAETATSLGHAFFDCFINAEYFHTTREELKDLMPSVTFEEEHSHATSHRCYIPIEMIKNDREIILVDDEMTTGKTALNIIQSIHTQYPRKDYTVVSILDWRSGEHIKEFEKLENTLGITINVVSLLAGKVQVNQFQNIPEQSDRRDHSLPAKQPIEVISLSSFFKNTGFSALLSHQSQAPFIEETGRFGISSDRNTSLHQQISDAAKYLSEKRNGVKTLCLGTGEFMYIPMKLAAEMGKNILFQSTTRSPIHIAKVNGYGARYGINFLNPEDESVAHFVYNIPPNEYDEVFIFFEREVTNEKLKPLLKQLENLQIKSIKVVFFSQS